MILKSKLIGKNINFRSVTVDDAEFILSLRLNPTLNKYLGTTSALLSDQQNWINAQISRPDDYYFMVESKDGKRLGTCGIYDVKKETFGCGRWINDVGAPAYVAVKYFNAKQLFL